MPASRSAVDVSGNARRLLSDSRRCRRAAQTGDNQNGSLSAGKDPEPTHLILRFRDQAVHRCKALNDANSAIGSRQSRRRTSVWYSSSISLLAAQKPQKLAVRSRACLALGFAPSAVFRWPPGQPAPLATSTARLILSSRSRETALCI